MNQGIDPQPTLLKRLTLLLVLLSFLIALTLANIH